MRPEDPGLLPIDRNVRPGKETVQNRDRVPPIRTDGCAVIHDRNGPNIETTLDIGVDRNQAAAG